MILKPLAVLAAASIVLAAPTATAADIRIKVSNKVLTKKRDGDTRSNQRQLLVKIDNRERSAYQGVTMEWTVIARNIDNRKLSIAGSGSKQVDIPASGEIEVSSDPFSFSKTEGKIKRIEENRFRPDRPQFNVDPDTGTRYAGYIVVLKKDGEVIAEAATAGMKKRVRGLTTKK